MIGSPAEIVKADSFGQCEEDDGELYEQALDDAEPACVRIILSAPLDRLGADVQPAYEWLAAKFTPDDENPVFAAFGRGIRGKKNKPIVLRVLALGYGLQQHYDRPAKLDRDLPAGEHVAFQFGGKWVATMLQKHGHRADMNTNALAARVYDIIAACRDDRVRLFKCEDTKFHEGKAREFTVWTVAELDAKPAEPLPVVEPKPETPVAEIAASIETEAREVVPGDIEGQLKYVLGSLKAHAEYERPGSVRRGEFDRIVHDLRGGIFEIGRWRHKLDDSADCAGRKFRDPVPIDLTVEPVPV